MAEKTIDSVRVKGRDGGSDDREIGIGARRGCWLVDSLVGLDREKL